MKNIEVFNDYDMVVCVPTKTINDQLVHLLKGGTIKPEFVVVQKLDGQNYSYEVLEQGSQIPRDAKGVPTVACIDGKIVPSVVVAESGTTITFVLKFQSGTAYFWQGNGPLAKLTPYDMTGWSYGIGITLDLAAVEKDDIGRKIVVPKLVEDQLRHFMSSMFTVNHLFMDFESTNLVRFDPAHSSAGSAGDAGLQQLVLFMNFYLKYLQAHGNPYILGYALTTGEATRYDKDQNVPDALKPTGTTFTLFHDPADASRSNLNFVLVTKGGHGKITGTPGTFDSNWIAPNEQCDAKMIYSHDVLIERFILRPFYDKLRNDVYAGIAEHISVPIGNEYAAGRTATGTGFNYVISDKASGDDQYVNRYSVDLENDQTTIRIKFTGHIALYKEVDRDMGFCNAKAHASGSVDWSSVVTISAQKNASGQPTLKLDRAFSIGSHHQDQDRNTCAEAFAWIGKILGTILDVLSAMTDKGFFSKLLDAVFDLRIPGLGDLNAAFGNIGGSIGTVLILPAGQVFWFKTPSIDHQANLALQLTYKAEN
ncbi:MAG TPA: hypothetical protein VHA77_05370 [Xanthobacteraceae bacterium]|nr:hypothetical protein [Xanthobacteraceae bacterium]